ncbi:CDP-glycerol glycerophosphotransferase family protein [Aequorivita capsosiphonis]|uniref:CDP-glycerol glycerophosphotransferase family protein n=1 Tax=Aequorivita capsosiphonis TaxID=487317 RepID=UPI0003FC10B6|nr:CDP-glycerol glycerophosphotransferase family protein [Aequorivita capsosiphonis]
MQTVISTFKKIYWRSKIKGINFLKKVLPKYNRVIIVGNHRLEDNAISLANYIVENYSTPVYYEISKEYINQAKKFLNPEVKILDSSKKTKELFKALTTKYIFFTYPYSLSNNTNSKRQKMINVWHGVGHKKIAKGRGRGSTGIPADLTIGTSDLSCNMFSEFFDVPIESVVITGYPRNDMMLNAQKDRGKLREKLISKLGNYKHFIIWMPTYRLIMGSEVEGTDRMPAGKKIERENIFQMRNFDAERFNAILKENNALCLVKPHQLFTTDIDESYLSNIKLINNDWIYERDMSLYQFLACTDALITDYSSVMIDYSLLDQPIFCIAEDLEEYKKTQGLYFDDHENWVPTELFQNQDDFLKAIEHFLSTGEDSYQVKRHKIRDVYFKYLDNQSSKRIVDFAFENKTLKGH